MPTKLIANSLLFRSRSSVNSFTLHKILLLFKLIMLVVVALPTRKLTISLLLQVGDVEQHPGPYKPKFPCMICEKAAKWNRNCLQCNTVAIGTTVTALICRVHCIKKGTPLNTGNSRCYCSLGKFMLKSMRWSYVF